MSEFSLPRDLMHNSTMIQDPVAYAKEVGCASWLFLIGEEFASMPGGISFTQVQEAVPHAARVISDPPRELTLDLARQQVRALDELPRPTLVSCRSGPRASATTYLYAGLRAGATPDDVIAAAEKADASFLATPAYREWVKHSLLALQEEEKAQQ